ncbi:MAG: hypothetical protein ABIF18_01680 [archaeon]
MKNKRARFGNLPCFPQMNFRKRGWMMILAPIGHDSGEPDATIAILIVSGALLVVYSQQTDREILPEQYYDSMQGRSYMFDVGNYINNQMLFVIRYEK